MNETKQQDTLKIIIDSKLTIFGYELTLGDTVITKYVKDIPMGWGVHLIADRYPVGHKILANPLQFLNELTSANRNKSMEEIEKDLVAHAAATMGDD